MAWLRNLSLLLSLSLLVPVVLFAQDGEDQPDTNPYGWELQGSFNLGVNQNAVSDNWAGDEIGSAAWLSSFNLIAEKQINERLNNRSTLRLEFGQTHQVNRETDTYEEPVKSADKIDLESVLSFTFGWAVNPYASLRIQSQFADHRGDTDDVYYYNPTTYTESVGVGRKLIAREKQEWLARIGFATRQTVDRNYYDEVEDTRVSEVISDAGFELVSELNTPVTSDRIMLTAKLTLYQAIHNSLADELEGLPEEDDWQATDVDLETIFTGSITELIKVNLQMRLLYDKEVDKAGRFKESLSIGVAYTFANP
ncbi:DUF3078 domain-containing protein [bacterium]|nr:DUF3078 domain-containing protein [bacterium]